LSSNFDWNEIKLIFLFTSPVKSAIVFDKKIVVQILITFWRNNFIFTVAPRNFEKWKIFLSLERVKNIKLQL
jgi:hypothetical protein